MENINRKDYDLSYKISINIDTVKKCISDLEKSKINDRKSFYSNSVLERFDKCNNNYVEEFDNNLNTMYNNLFNKEGKIDHSSFKRFIKLSNRLTSNIYNNYVDVLYSLIKE